MIGLFDPVDVPALIIAMVGVSVLYIGFEVVFYYADKNLKRKMKELGLAKQPNENPES
ncbi:MAG: hypothetical protein VKK32_06775 [Candidatus Melainabacteria bacterium]|nr:hypothetical protein [Candidatus Melainabacteria bacterium]